MIIIMIMITKTLRREKDGEKNGECFKTGGGNCLFHHLVTEILL